MAREAANGDNWAMVTGYPPVPRLDGDVVGTILLLVLHMMLVLATLVIVLAIHNEYEYHNYNCRYAHECSNPLIDTATWIGLGGSAVLFIVDLVLAISRMVKRQAAIYVPVVCCIAQVIVAGATFAVGLGT
jgi:predicted transglutaminase-like protease